MINPFVINLILKVVLIFTRTLYRSFLSFLNLNAILFFKF